MEVTMSLEEDHSHNPFTTLPLEMLLRITDDLNTPELGKFRLTCRYVEQSLDKYFIAEYFTIKKFMLTEFSLNALLDISQSRLSPYLRQLHIGMEDFRCHAIYCGRRDQRGDSQLHRVENSSLFRDLAAETALFRITGSLMRTLTQSLDNFSGLETIVLRHHSSKTRERDNPPHSWDSYGHKTVMRETGHVLGTRENDMLWQPATASDVQRFEDAFMLAVQALANAPNCPATGIELLSTGIMAVGDPAFIIPANLEPAMTPVLSRLQKLHVTLSWTLSWDSQPTGFSHSAQHNFRHFLTQCTDLRDFRVNRMRSYSDGGVITFFLEWLCATSPSEVLPRLERLSIGYADLGTEIMVSTLCRFRKTLSGLAFWNINIPGRSSGNKTQKQDNWMNFFKQMLEIEGLDSLHNIRLGRLNQGSGDHQFVYGPRPNDDYSNYSGPDWKQFVKELIALNKGGMSNQSDAVSEEQPEVSAEEESEEEEEEEEDEEEDDE